MIRWAICILFLANLSTASGAVQPRAISEKEFQIYQELAQTKLDATQSNVNKDMQSLQTRLDNQDKRLDDQQSRIGDIGLYLTLFGTLIALVVAALGLIGYFSVRTRTREEAREVARTESKKWFDQEAQSIKQKISNFEQQIDQDSNDLHDKKTEFLALVEVGKQTVQEEMSRSPTDSEPSITATTPAAKALSEIANQLRNKPESEYNFDDWNNRAFAAFQSNQLEDAIYFWQRATEIKNANPTDFARVLLNKGLTLGKLNRSEDAIRVYDDLIARFGNDTEPALREQVASANNSKGFALLCRAKMQWQDTPTRMIDLTAATACFTAALDKSNKPAQRAMILGNQAYVAALSGEPEQSVRDSLQDALQLGCEELYLGTLKDLEISPVPEDTHFRLLLDTVWDEVKPRCEASKKA